MRQYARSSALTPPKLTNVLNNIGVLVNKTIRFECEAFGNSDHGVRSDWSRKDKGFSMS
jgi:hypothetical protein